MPEPQSFKNHTRRDLPYLFSVLVLLANLIATLTMTVKIAISPEHKMLGLHIWLVIVSAALAAMAMNLRVKDLRVQNRVIRLEERLRYAAILQPTEQATAAKLTLGQMIALRFAADAELPTLIPRAVRENLTSKQIKGSITTWRADDLRV
ncbi:hypothetical protein HDF16_002575 [Granulicella aggregans]|uniref:Uncharacterized protein n=1 Tax=Granulicella aggregans TaxID=474949 RepID=A0A7W7ZE13_9BACT|nr:DUF6526 family protein [Granulicella aggregans]MBB5057869.1 hypothetical protein [Granulicella aggregans]